MTRIALATAREVPDLDDEARLLLTSLVDRGAVCEPAVWDDEAVDWSTFDLVVVRCTWDYAERVEEFLAWAAGVAAVTRLENSLSHLRFTTDKHYLQVLADADVPVVPSAFLEPGERPEHPYLDVEHVVKPAISAGSRGTLRLGADEADASRAHAMSLLDAGRSVLVQPYLADVDTAGETAMVLLGGTFSHALRKGPLLQRGAGLVEGLFAQEEMSPRDPSEAERQVADRAMAAVADVVPGRTTYARVDLLPTPDGPVVLEVELAEPSLFLDHVPGSAARAADAILATLG